MLWGTTVFRPGRSTGMVRQHDFDATRPMQFLFRSLDGWLSIAIIVGEGLEKTSCSMRCSALRQRQRALESPRFCFTRKTRGRNSFTWHAPNSSNIRRTVERCFYPSKP